MDWGRGGGGQEFVVMHGYKATVRGGCSLLLPKWQKPSSLLDIGCLQHFRHFCMLETLIS